jgi:hypothetical protein
MAIMGCSELINHFLSEIVDARIERGNVLFRRHVLDNMRKHLPDFFERRLLPSRHMQQMYHSAPK